jgi:hypothetical protein
VHWPEHAAEVEVPEPNVPAGQAVHTPAPAREYCPAAHAAAVALADPATQKYPACKHAHREGVGGGRRGGGGEGGSGRGTGDHAHLPTPDAHLPTPDALT